MKVVKYLILLLLILVIGFSIHVEAQPNSFEVTHTKTMNTPQAVIYSDIIDFKNWEDKDGISTMKIIATTHNSSITEKLQFAHFPQNDITWCLKSNEDRSIDVTYTISDKDSPFGLKAFATIMGGMESEIGPPYERGLVMLDSVLQEGIPLTVYNEMAETVIMSNGIPINERVELPSESDISLGFMPNMKVLKTTLTGNYTNLPKAREATIKHLTKQGFEQSEYKPYEIHATDLGFYPNPSDWITEIYVPIKE